ncbi:MAG: hypothetical protein Ct9H300mP15_13990 [Gemmatimonadota bacterium]|nr:MAG: hypothetical protein Ct9H300mP15_13990 [Gemmatimonadota bacterium]
MLDGFRSTMRSYDFIDPVEVEGLEVYAGGGALEASVTHVVPWDMDQDTGQKALKRSREKKTLCCNSGVSPGTIACRFCFSSMHQDCIPYASALPS